MTTNKNEPKIGNNGVPFGKGYKGAGMCAACSYSSKMNNPSDTKTFTFCGYYGRRAARVSRNCTGIKLFRQPTTEPTIVPLAPPTPDGRPCDDPLCHNCGNPDSVELAANKMHYCPDCESRCYCGDGQDDSFYCVHCEEK